MARWRSIADSTIFANERQIACAERARKYLAMALESLDMGETLDAVTVMIDNGCKCTFGADRRKSYRSGGRRGIFKILRRKVIYMVLFSDRWFYYAKGIF